MLLMFMGVAAGLAAGFFLPFSPPEGLVPFLAAAALATADALLFYILSHQEGNISQRRFVKEWSIVLVAALIIIAFGKRLGASLDMPVLTALAAKMFIRPLFPVKTGLKSE